MKHEELSWEMRYRLLVGEGHLPDLVQVGGKAVPHHAQSLGQSNKVRRRGRGVAADSGVVVHGLVDGVLVDQSRNVVLQELLIGLRDKHIERLHVFLFATIEGNVVGQVLDELGHKELNASTGVARLIRRTGE